MRRLDDKEEQLRAAWRVDVDTPRTEFVRSAADLAGAAADLAFPAIFKPVESLAFKSASPGRCCGSRRAPSSNRSTSA